MGVVRRLLWKEEPVVDSPDINWGIDAVSATRQNGENAASIEHDGETYRVQYANSRDDQWTAAYGRAISSGTLRAFVLREGSLIWTKTLERPFTSAIGTDGTSVFLSGGDSRSLGNVVYAFGPNGEQLLEDSLDSNCSSIAVSDDGRYGAVVSKQPDCKIHVYDLTAQTKLDTYDPVEEGMGLLAFQEWSGELRLYVSAENASEPLYAIDMEGETVWQSKRLIQRTPYFTRLMNKYR